MTKVTYNLSTPNVDVVLIAPDQDWGNRMGFDKAASFYAAASGESRYLRPLIKFFGGRLVDEIQQLDIDEAADALCPNACGATINRQVYTPCSAVLKFSAAHGWCKRYRINRPRVGKKIVHLPSQSELHAFACAAGPSLKQIIRFKLETNATEHEILALDWSQVDVSRRQAQLRRADGNIRTTTLSPSLVELLLRRSKNQNGRVFRSDSGRPYAIRGNYGSRLKTAFNGASQRSGVKLTFSMLHHIWCARERGKAQSMSMGHG